MARIIRELQDMTYLNWAKVRNSSGTAGSFLKAYEDTSDGKTYYEQRQKNINRAQVERLAMMAKVLKCNTSQLCERA